MRTGPDGQDWARANEPAKGAAMPASKSVRRVNVMTSSPKLLASPLTSAAVARVECIAQAIADQVERQHREKNRKSRPDRHPGCVDQKTLRRIQHAAP